jgi:hypothetical protein
MLRLRPTSRRAARLLAVSALAAVFVAPAAASAASNPFDALTGWWPMYEGSGQTVHDLSGHGDNGQLGSTPGVDANDPTWIKSFFIFNALRFDGNDFVRIPDAPALRSPQVTVSAWVRGSTSPGQFKYVLGKGADGCQTSSYALYTGDGGGLSFYVQDTTGTTHPSGAVAPAAVWNGKWHHVDGTWDGTTSKLFVDGKLVPGTAGTAGTINYGTSTTGDVGVGDFLGTCDLYYTGDIDNVATFNQALPVDQIWSKISALFTKPLR